MQMNLEESVKLTLQELQTFVDKTSDFTIHVNNIQYNYDKTKVTIHLVVDSYLINYPINIFIKNFNKTGNSNYLIFQDDDSFEAISEITFWRYLFKKIYDKIEDERQYNFDYQIETGITNCNKDNYNKNLINCVFGIVGESGEIIDLLKKHLFQSHSLDIKKLKEEIGDLFWYLSELCNIFNFKFKTIQEENIEKLRLRYPDAEFKIEDSIKRRDKK
jgi:NTP pyrophosphatase (non-canonical NTP hydrolase)